jgi:formate dehydrogenase subunit beta
LGRRANCRRCKTKIPRGADLACGNWGVIGEKAGKATFVEICSDKGADLLTKAVAAGALATEAPIPKGIEIRGKVENAMLKLGDKWRAKNFEALGGTGMSALKTMMEETSRCIKCYSCVDNCPVNFDMQEEGYRNAEIVKPGEVPPNFMFHLIRLQRVSDSCINCGQCEELCPMDIPNSLFSHAWQVELEEMSGYKPGMDLSMPTISRLDDAPGFE